MKPKVLLAVVAIAALTACSEGLLPGEEPAADTGPGVDTMTPGDTGTADTRPGEKDGGGVGNDAGLQMEGHLTPLGHYSISDSYQMTGRLVPGPESGRELTGGQLTVEPVTLEKKDDDE